jgi:hypothetical protein
MSESALKSIIQKIAYHGDTLNIDYLLKKMRRPRGLKQIDNTYIYQGIDISTMSSFTRVLMKYLFNASDPLNLKNNNKPTYHVDLSSELIYTQNNENNITIDLNINQLDNIRYLQVNLGICNVGHEFIIIKDIITNKYYVIHSFNNVHTIDIDEYEEFPIDKLNNILQGDIDEYLDFFHIKSGDLMLQSDIDCNENTHIWFMPMSSDLDSENYYDISKRLNDLIDIELLL